MLYSPWDGADFWKKEEKINFPFSFHFICDDGGAPFPTIERFRGSEFKINFRALEMQILLSIIFHACAWICWCITHVTPSSLMCVCDPYMICSLVWLEGMLEVQGGSAWQTRAVWLQDLFGQYRMTNSSWGSLIFFAAVFFCLLLRVAYHMCLSSASTCLWWNILYSPIKSRV